MGNAKREALALIQQLPDNSSLEDIQYHLYIREKVEHGLRDLKSKQTLRPEGSRTADEEVAQRVIWTETAWIDLENIADHIARDSPYYAASFMREIRDHARSLSRMAMRGHVVPEIGTNRFVN